jgi:phage terminase Nu1 subunit (DNA packaging protein)
VRAQANTILAETAATGTVSQSDSAYLTQLVSGRTGLSPTDAQTRVNSVLAQQQADMTKAKQVADAARKASAKAAIFTFVSLLIGAFIASVAGAIGGRLRDAY